MKTSAKGRAAITTREGRRNHAYRDSKGLWTIGVGHLLPQTRASHKLVWTNAQIDAQLAVDLGRFEKAVNGVVKVPVTQNQFDAMVSLAFNIGEHGFHGSTVVHKLNAGDKAGDKAGAADAFLMWEHPHELAARRISERKQFLS